MASTLKDLIENLKAIEQELPEVLRRTTEIMANDGKALAERTIKDKGFGALYSSRKSILPYELYSKALNRKGTKFLDDLEDKNEEFTNWAEFRQAQGLQTNFVDLSYSSRMWMGMRPEPVREENGKYIAMLGHNDKEGAKKMNANFERYGDFIGLALRGQEEVLKEVAVENLYLLLDKFLK